MYMSWPTCTPTEFTSVDHFYIFFYTKKPKLQKKKINRNDVNVECASNNCSSLFTNSTSCRAICCNIKTILFCFLPLISISCFSLPLLTTKNCERHFPHPFHFFSNPHTHTHTKGGEKINSFLIHFFFAIFVRLI